MMNILYDRDSAYRTNGWTDCLYREFEMLWLRFKLVTFTDHIFLKWLTFVMRSTLLDESETNITRSLLCSLPSILPCLLFVVSKPLISIEINRFLYWVIIRIILISVYRLKTKLLAVLGTMLYIHSKLVVYILSLMFTLYYSKQSSCCYVGI